MSQDALSVLLDDILDDLSSRFIINLPGKELSSVTRICFGLEQAHWFYEDFFRPKYPTLPSVSLRAFTAALFSHCPLLWKFSGQHEEAFDNFLKYKIRVPVRGAIMLNQDLDRCVLVKGWKSSSGWSFPKGKIDEGEADAACAVREVLEECGFDISPYLLEDEYIDLVMKEQRIRLYVVLNVPLDTAFEPQTRKEISKIDWFTLDELPTYRKGVDALNGASKNKFYMVVPFLGPLRKWIKKRQKASKPLTAMPVVDVPTVKASDRSSDALKALLGVKMSAENAAESQDHSRAPIPVPAPGDNVPSGDPPPYHDLLDLLRASFTTAGQTAPKPEAETIQPASQSSRVRTGGSGDLLHLLRPPPEVPADKPRWPSRPGRLRQEETEEPEEQEHIPEHPFGFAAFLRQQQERTFTYEPAPPEVVFRNGHRPLTSSRNPGLQVAQTAAHPPYPLSPFGMPVPMHQPSNDQGFPPPPPATQFPQLHLQPTPNYSRHPVHPGPSMQRLQPLSPKKPNANAPSLLAALKSSPSKSGLRAVQIAEGDLVGRQTERGNESAAKTANASSDAFMLNYLTRIINEH